MTKAVVFLRNREVSGRRRPLASDDTFTTGFSKEVAREGIRVCCIRTGHVYDEMHASGGEPGRVDRVRDTIAIGRGGQPEEVARAILLLASNQASFITGTFLDITGASEQRGQMEQCRSALAAREKASHRDIRPPVPGHPLSLHIRATLSGLQACGGMLVCIALCQPTVNFPRETIALEDLRRGKHDAQFVVALFTLA